MRFKPGRIVYDVGDVVEIATDMQCGHGKFVKGEHVKVVEAGPGDHQYLVCKLDNFKATIMIHDHPVGAEIRELAPPRAKETPE
jgi:hypothetical protein